MIKSGGNCEFGIHIITYSQATPGEWSLYTIAPVYSNTCGFDREYPYMFHEHLGTLNVSLYRG